MIASGIEVENGPFNPTLVQFKLAAFEPGDVPHHVFQSYLSPIQTYLY